MRIEKKWVSVETFLHVIDPLELFWLPLSLSFSAYKVEAMSVGPSP